MILKRFSSYLRSICNKAFIVFILIFVIRKMSARNPTRVASKRVGGRNKAPKASIVKEAPPPPPPSEIIEEELPVPPLEDLTKFGPLSIKVQQVLTAILLLESPEKNIVEDSLNSLLIFLKKADENKDLFVEVDGLPPIRKRLFESSSVIQRLCIKILALASTVHKAKLFIRNEELITDLLTLSQLDDDVIVENAVLAISKLSTLHSGRMQIIQNGGLPILACLLTHGDPDIQRNALDTIWQLSADSFQVGQIANERCASAVLQMVNSEYPPLQGIALMILEKVTYLPEGVAALKAVNCFTILANKLANENMVDLHRYCLRILINLCRNRGTCKKSVSVIPAVADMIERTLDVATQLNALELLGRLCSVERVAKGVSKCGVPQMLSEMLTKSEDDVTLREMSAFAIAQIVRRDDTVKAAFAQCLPVFIGMIKNESTTPAGLKASLIAISSIMEDTSNSMDDFMKGSGCEIYQNLLTKSESHSNDEIFTTLKTINTIASSTEHCLKLSQAHFLPLMLNLLQTIKHEESLALISDIICNILSDQSTHDEFRSLKGLDTLQKIVDQGEFSVVNATVPIIIVVCKDPALGAELTEKGLLKSIWKRSDLVTQAGQLRSCFDQLVGTDLSLKYGLEGHLGPNEKLENGFCDLGGLKGHENLKKPVEFTWANRQRGEKVLLLSLDPTKFEEAVVKNNSSLNSIQNPNDIRDIISAMQSKQNETENASDLVGLIANAVSDRFGGPLDNWKVTSYSEDFEIESLQTKYQSVIIPVSSISTGGFRTRALVFKAVCDACGIPCSLETQDFKRTWNVVYLQPDGCQTLPMTGEIDKSMDGMGEFVVDIVFQPGHLLPLGSFEAETYIAAS